MQIQQASRQPIGRKSKAGASRKTRVDFNGWKTFGIASQVASLLGEAPGMLLGNRPAGAADAGLQSQLSSPLCCLSRLLSGTTALPAVASYGDSNFSAKPARCI